METKRNDQRRNHDMVFTFVFESWSIPLIGLLMLLIGGFAGYNLRLNSDPTGAQAVQPPQIQQNSQPRLGDDQTEIMDYVLSQARHFKGSPDAPVTIIEFGDFQ